MTNKFVIGAFGFVGLAMLAPMTWVNVQSLLRESRICTQVENYESIGLTASKAGDFGRAVTAYGLAYGLAPDRVEIKQALIVARASQTAKHPEMISQAQARELSMEIKISGLSEASGPEIGVAMGQLDLILGKVSEAHARFDRVVEKFPQSAVAQFAAAKSSSMRGDRAQAIARAASASQLDGGRDDYHAALGHYLMGAEKWNRAEGALARASELAQRAGTLESLARVRIRLEKYEPAVKTLQAALAVTREPANRARLRGSLGFAYYKMGRYDEAIGELRNSYKGSKDPGVLHNLGIVYQSIGDHRNAVAIFTRTLADDPSNADGHVRLVKAMVSLGRKDSARAHVHHLERLSASKPELLPTLKMTRRFLDEPDNKTTP